MIFGVKEKRTALGQFTSEKCSSCKKNDKYIFYRITKFIVILFIKLIPISNKYECECTECEDTMKIDKKAGKKLAKQKFGIENSNQNFGISMKLFLAAVVVAAAIVLPMILIAPPLSPDMVKSLVEEPGDYTIVNDDNDIIAVIQVGEDSKKIVIYNDIKDYKTPDGNKLEVHKFYEEIVTNEGSYMSPMVDEFGNLVDDNDVKIHRYYYDLAKGTYGFAVGVEDISSIEYTDNKAVYPISYIATDETVYKYKFIVFTEENWEINARFEVAEDGTEGLIDLLVMDKQDGRVVTQTMYLPNAKDGSIVYLGDLSSSATGQVFYDFVNANDLQISYIDNYTYYKDSDVIISSTTTTTDESGNTNVNEIRYDVARKYNYYILTEAG